MRRGDNPRRQSLLDPPARFYFLAPVALSKHSAKEEFAAFGKGKWNADLATYAALNAQDIHSGYLNRLYTSRDYEASLVNMMKDKYEVTSIRSFLLVRFNIH